MASTQQIQQFREHEMLEKEISEMEQLMRDHSKLALQMIEIDQICQGMPAGLADLKMESWEQSEAGFEGGAFSFNDPDVRSRKIWVLEQMTKIEKKLEIPKLHKMEQVGEIQQQMKQLHLEGLKICEEAKKMQEMVKKVPRSDGKFQKVLKMSAAVAFGAVVAQMPLKMQVAVGFAATAALFVKMQEKMEQISEIGEKIFMKMDMIEMKMQMAENGNQQISNKNLEMMHEIVHQLGDLKVLSGGSLVSSLSKEFGMTFPGGNVIRSFMKLVEKISYCEIRMMHLVLDGREAQRQVGQKLEGETDFKKMLASVVEIGEIYVSARIRFRDHIKIDMSQIKAQWQIIVEAAGKVQIATAEKQISEMNKSPDAKASHADCWKMNKESVEKIMKMDWESEIDRFKVEA